MTTATAAALASQRPTPARLSTLNSADVEAHDDEQLVQPEVLVRQVVDVDPEGLGGGPARAGGRAWRGAGRRGPGCWLPTAHKPAAYPFGPRSFAQHSRQTRSPAARDRWCSGMQIKPPSLASFTALYTPSLPLFRRRFHAPPSIPSPALMPGKPSHLTLACAPPPASSRWPRTPCGRATASRESSPGTGSFTRRPPS